MPQKITQVDAFTAEPFRGNPAAVCVLEGEADPGWMQAVAAEMNLAETAYLVPKGEAWGLRWFTPTTEVPLCGHATLASAHVLWEEGHAAPDATLAFDTKSGRLTATRAGDWIELGFPREDNEPYDGGSEAAEALGVQPVNVAHSPRLNMLLLEAADEEAVRETQPDYARLARVPHFGFIVTARSDDPAYAFVSRFFAPHAGINEDPVTGAAHCVLAPYWAERLGKREMLADQASARGGTVRVRLDNYGVTLAGQAVTTLRGELSEVAS